MSVMMRTLSTHVLITGGTGLIGRVLCQHLSDLGCQLTMLTRNIQKASLQSGVEAAYITDLDQIPQNQKIDVIINLAGEPISQRWTPTVKQKLIHSRVDLTQNIIQLISRLDVKPVQLISGSAIGIYGASLDKQFTEDTILPEPSESQFPQYLCSQWEKAALKAEDYGVKTCLLRTGVVLSKEGGALMKILRPFQFGLGGKIGHGHQWFSWIHIDDIVHLILHILQHKVSGIVNATAPGPVTNATFTKALGATLHRPVKLTTPAWLVLLLFGQMGQDLLLEGQRVVPIRALTMDFIYRYPNIDMALHHLLGRKKPVTDHTS